MNDAAINDATDSSSSSPPLITNLDIIRNAALKALEDNDDVEAERLFELILHLLDVQRKQPPSKWASRAYEGIATCKRVRGDGDDTVDALEKCVFWDDAYAGGWLSLAEECVEKDRFARAAEAFRAFRERYNEFFSEMEEALALSVQMRLRFRLEDLQKARNDASCSAGPVQMIEVLARGTTVDHETMRGTNARSTVKQSEGRGNQPHTP